MGLINWIYVNLAFHRDWDLEPEYIIHPISGTASQKQIYTRIITVLIFWQNNIEIKHKQEVKLRLAEIIRSAFLHKNGSRRYKLLVLYPWATIVLKSPTLNTLYDEETIIRMLNFLINNIYVVIGGTVFQQTIEIPICTNCAPLLADLFLYSYETEFVMKILSKKDYRSVILFLI